MNANLSRRDFNKGLLAGSMLSLLPLPGNAQETKGEVLLFVGTYASEDAKGIYGYELNEAAGDLKLVSETGGVANPSYLAIHPNRKFLYAVNETGNFNGQKTGGVSAFAVESTSGKLTLLNQQSSRGAGPCYVSVDQTGKWVFAANYGGGSVAMFPIHEDGRLGEATDFVQHEGSSVNRQRQSEPHAHSIVVDPANRFAYAPDLGMDKIVIYRLDLQQGKLIKNDPPAFNSKPGSGPRHFTFHPTEKLAFSIQELSSEITSYTYDPESGALQEIQTVPALPADFKGPSTAADIHVSPDGMFVYGSNRGHDSIVIFKLNPSNGQLTFVGRESTQGKNPRNFAIDPTGHYLLVANQDSDSIVQYQVDAATGILSPTGKTLQIPKPVCIKFLL